MGNLFANRLANSRSIRTSGVLELSSDLAVVYDVILDENHPSLQNKSNKSIYIGAIKYRDTNNSFQKDSDLPFAFNLHPNRTELPTLNEIVKIVNNASGVFYERIFPSETPNLNAVVNQISIKKEDKADNKNLSVSIGEIRNVQETGIAQSNTAKEDKFNKYGEYFTPTLGIHKLKLYEGDLTIESRFGQSIRFSGYNNPNKSFSPTIIIRNGENEISKALPGSSTTEEDINKDGSVIVLSSGQKQLDFQPGLVDKNGGSDFETKPASFDKFPTKLDGDQIVLNSGRIVLSSKSGEMIFYSKKNYGFISDGGLSIDNKLGIDVSVGDDIFVMTNDRNINLYTGDGSIFLGNKELEPLVKGQQLVNLLVDLMDAIINMQFLTPSGPTKIGPENKPKFDEISGKLNNILSKKNQTS